jgi:hypothetical protein
MNFIPQLLSNENDDSNNFCKNWGIEDFRTFGDMINLNIKK